jgi:glutamate dehydrogenase
VNEIITLERIHSIVDSNADLLVRCFEDFCSCARDGARPAWNSDLANMIEERLGGRDPLAVHVLLMFLKFNQSVLVTNFFRSDSPPASVAYRLDPKVVLAGRPKSLYPEVPFGIYLVVGRTFHGFHVRFREIARGGIRLIRSPDEGSWSRNNASLFEEAFNLAYTQQLKNKDIPEGGAKGVILLDSGDLGMSQAFSHDCFLKYLDALLDCMLLPAGVKSHLANEEILFFGPDENTADCMDLGCRRARDRGFRYWKAITTGKSVSLGGVPHDVYGITTRGVRTYVRELYRVLKLDETQVTKFQTGGPDGDLGSNEILQSCDRTVAIVDGSGVAYDPNGLNRPELERLARARQMICHFNKSLLAKEGFLVTIGETDVTLPDGSKWRSGMELRNEFVFTKYAKADLFVPCGGRPGTVREGNVQRLFEGEKPAWKMIVEGANLFFTAGARQSLEKSGVHLFKDSSANKGGVTSSSLEVLASLCLPSKDHDRLLTRGDDNAELPDFYLKYVDAIIQRIEDNCVDEFGVIWRATAEAEEPMTKVEASAQVSKQINSLTDHIGRAELSRELMLEVLKMAIPELLVERFGAESLLDRMPPAYAKATVAYYLASKYVYQTGITGNNVFAFHAFMQRFQGGLVEHDSPPDSPARPDSPTVNMAFTTFLDR